MDRAVFENAFRFRHDAAPSLGFMPVETARGTVYFPMQRCRYGHWWTVGDYCESCAKVELDVSTPDYEDAVES